MGNLMGDMAAHHYENAWKGCYPKKLSPLLPCHSGEGLGPKSLIMTNPPQVMSPNVEQDQSQETTAVKQQPPDDASLRPKKRERMEEDLTPKSEPSQVEVKEEPDEQDSDEPAGSEEQEELRQAREEFPPASSSEPTPRRSELSRGSTDLYAHRGSTDPYAHCSIEQSGLSMIEVLLRMRIQ